MVQIVNRVLVVNICELVVCVQVYNAQIVGLRMTLLDCILNVLPALDSGKYHREKMNHIMC